MLILYYRLYKLYFMFNLKLIIIMYIYHVVINALSAHMIHINLNMIFYTHVENTPTKTIYIKYYKTKTKQNALQTLTHICARAHTHTHTHTHMYIY